MLYPDPFNYILFPLGFMPLLNTLFEPVYVIKHLYLDAKAIINHHQYPNSPCYELSHQLSKQNIQSQDSIGYFL